VARGELTTRLRALLGTAAPIETTPDGVPRVAPRTTAECALLLRTASADGWRVRVTGAETWTPPDAPADLFLTTRALRGAGLVSAADLVATAETGVPLDTLRRAFADHGAWLALDAPGAPGRSLGSLLATATAGPLRAGFGLLRDQVLGLTLVTGDGRVVTVGGRVVKDVAGYDLAKLAVGSFGAFGVVTTVHLRLRAIPRADQTLVGTGRRDAVLDVARAILAGGLTPAALELMSPAAARTDAWTVAIRLVGTGDEVAADRAAVQQASPIPLVERTGADAAAFWQEMLDGGTAAPVTLRAGALPTGLEDALDLVALHLDEAVRDWLTVTVPAGTLRWSGAAGPDALIRFRDAAAAREWPVTIERAPWGTCLRLGHFGAYREGVHRLVTGLRSAFDPAGILVAPLSGNP